MQIDQKKLRELIARQAPPFSPDELRREDSVFFVGGNLPERETVETLYDSHFQSNAALFHLTFGNLENFAQGEAMARAIKKNFHAHLVGRLDFPAPAPLIRRAYAAGVDILDLPPAAPGAHQSGSDAAGQQLEALAEARAVFPRWSVVSTLSAGAEPAGAVRDRIDALLEAEVLPLVALSGGAERLDAEELAGIYTHLNAAWRRKKVALKPLLPLIYLSTPFAPAAPRGVLRGFIDTIDDRRLLAASDLRRLLRVKEVAESYESSGL